MFGFQVHGLGDGYLRSGPWCPLCQSFLPEGRAVATKAEVQIQKQIQTDQVNITIHGEFFALLHFL